MQTLRVWQLLALHAALLAVNAMAALVLGDPRHWGPVFTAWFYALPLAQIALAGAWFALDQERLSWRLPMAFVLFAIASLGLDLPLTRSAVRLVERDTFLLLAIHGLVVPLVFLPYRTRRGWHVVRPVAKPQSVSANRMQFGVQDALLWTAAIAAVMGLCRSLLGDGGFWPSYRAWRGPWLSAIAMALLMITAFRAVYVRGGRRVAMQAAARDWFLITVGQVTLAHDGFEPPWTDGVWLLNAGLFLVMLGSLIVLRNGGCRLERRRSSEEERAAARRTAVWLLIVLNLLLPLAGSDRELVFVSQATLLAMWFALGRARFHHRLVPVLLLLIGNSLWLAVLEATYGHSRGMIFHALLLGVVWLCIQAPLWALRVRGGIGLATPVAASPPLPMGDEYQNLQRALVRAFVWTTLIGLVASLILAWGAIVGGRTIRSLELYGVLALWITLFALSACLLLTSRLMPIAIVVAIASCLAGAFGPEILSRFIFQRSDFRVIDLEHPFLQYLPLLVILLYLRALGYRLGRIRQDA